MGGPSLGGVGVAAVVMWRMIGLRGVGVLSVELELREESLVLGTFNFNSIELLRRD